MNLFNLFKKKEEKEIKEEKKIDCPHTKIIVASTSVACIGCKKLWLYKEETERGDLFILIKKRVK